MDRGGSGHRDASATLDLVSVEDDSQGDTLRVAINAELSLQPVDTSDWSNLLERTFESPVRLGAHLRATEWRTATSADRRLFQAPFRSGIRLEQYQLLPLAKALELPRVNLLIADDVGLGKTIEAGLIVRELMLRRRVSFVVVAAPASMQSRWQDELSQKFGLDFTIVDREYLLESRRRRGFSANPWSIGSRFTGRTSLEERDRIKQDFNAPFEKAPIRILVCTDAAREGLNLQTRCRDLIHIDLPWNPSRLEQRNGRIDVSDVTSISPFTGAAHVSQFDAASSAEGRRVLRLKMIETALPRSLISVISNFRLLHIGIHTHSCKIGQKESQARLAGRE